MGEVEQVDLNRFQWLFDLNLFIKEWFKMFKIDFIIDKTMFCAIF